jgi:Flp pilus assembly protein TadB
MGMATATDSQWTSPGSGGRPSMGELFSRLSEQSSRLLRSEIELAKAELSRKAKAGAIGAGLLAGAALFGFFGFAVVLATIILALSLVLEPWLAALIVALVLLVVAAVLALAGKKSLEKGVPPTPERTTENVKQDVQAVKEGLRS